jgi:hypothetical protein
MKVTPIHGEVGRYRVESRSKKDAPEHTCDILNSECGCRGWICNHASHVRLTDQPYLCAHLKAAREYAFNDYLEVMREVALSQ